MKYLLVNRSLIRLWVSLVYILSAGTAARSTRFLDDDSLQYLTPEGNGIRVYTLSENGSVVPVTLPNTELPRPKYPIPADSGAIPKNVTETERGNQEIFTCHGERLVAKNREYHLNLHNTKENQNGGKVEGQGYRRIKRQAPVAYNVQVVLVGDYGLFTRFLAVNGNDDQVTLMAMTDYYANVFRAVSRRYESTIRPDFSVSVTPTSFVFLTAPNSSPWTEDNKVGTNVRAAPSLIAFNTFGATLTSTFGVDHAILITGYDLRSTDLRNDLLGVAYSFGVCSEEPTSLVEESFTEQTANTVAHEIGHSLGLSHDGDGNTCSENDFFVMASTNALPTSIDRASNPWTFSSCSVEVLRSFLAMSDAACTLVDTATVTTDFSSFTVREYGQRVDADSQCQARYGALSRFCREDYLLGSGLTFDDMCYNMKCFNPVAGRCVLVPAHDGTSCGDGKWCLKGLCVANAQAPPRLSNCPQLDDPTRSCSLASCADPLAVLIYCCSTCSQVSPSLPPSAPPSVGPSPSVQAFVDFFTFLNILV